MKITFDTNPTNYPQGWVAIMLVARNRKEREQLQALAQHMQAQNVPNTRKDNRVNKETQYLQFIVQNPLYV